MHLELPLAIHHIQERRASVPAARRDPAGYPVRAIGFLAGLKVVNHGGCRNHALELMRKGLDPPLAQARQLGPAIIGARRGVVHAAGGY
jgi:hypothetical protein